MSKGTPGPWGIFGTAIAKAPRGQPTIAVMLTVPGSDEWQHDARLIAAAPEMAELLREVASFEDRWADIGEIWNAITKARALLARIEGET